MDGGVDVGADRKQAGMNDEAATPEFREAVLSRIAFELVLEQR